MCSRQMDWEVWAKDKGLEIIELGVTQKWEGVVIKRARMKAWGITFKA